MRIARLDGIRAVAVTMVFAQHALHFKLGWAGVDLFFVLSGYLITSILRRDRKQASFWSSFYLKRVTRIIPPLLIFFLLAVLFADFPWHKLGIYYALFAANIGEAIYSRYPLQWNEMQVLWSLAVEEHFYLVWPFAVRNLERKNLIRLLLAVLFVEPLLRYLFTPIVPTWWVIYVLTPFRLDGLAAGSLLAILVEDPTWTVRLKATSGWISTVGALGILALWLSGRFNQSSSLWFNSLGYSATALVAVFWIAHTLFHEESRVSHFLSSRPVVFIGVISYGLYLYHNLLLRGEQLLLWRIHYDHMRTFYPIVVPVIIVFSWLSFRYYETPVIRWGHRKAAQRDAHRSLGRSLVG